MSAARRLVTVAYADARVISYPVIANTGERKRLEHLLAQLRSIGRVATYGCQLPPPWMPVERVVDAIAGAVGRMTVEVAEASPSSSRDPMPAWLMPVWPFDHERGGLPASTGDLLGATLELRASPCGDEEGGVPLPGYPGRWYISASTLGA